ncbi:PorT family protein [Hymenobacter sp. 5317J-9]|uniref:outer membrane beta-barrel protein n=1 Tax=Hymenobacter sp. 5317J-9 TaxID=2932250 RepID=UPI001FD6A84D|nr:outer membrane beta-barrel protein [Hymenobacter sp. 5317J-9]UOQ99190.1 PorT family protein [Hymenobacter sp. 5317J-9]
MKKVYLKHLLLAVSLLAVSSTAQAQKNFRPGYVVPLAGDTLRGEVDVRGGQRMASFCQFRPAGGGQPVRYAPTDLKAYGLSSGDQYEARPLPAAAGAAPAYLFLQVLARGKAALYSYTDEDSRPRYYLQKTGEPAVVELVQNTQNVRGETGVVQESSYPFRRVLSQAFADCFAVQPMLPHAELKEATLVAIFERYNTCDPAAGAAAKTMARTTKFHFGLRAGMQKGDITYYHDGRDEIKMASELKPVFGVGLLLMPGAFNTKWSFGLEALYQSQQYHTTYQRSSGFVSSSNTYHVDITLQTLRVPLAVRYAPLQGRIQPYLQAGIETAVLLNTHQARYSVTTPAQGTALPVTTTTTEVALRPLGFGPAGSIGLQVPVGTGSVQAEARYNQLDNSSRATNTLDGAKTITFLLGYNF